MLHRNPVDIDLAGGGFVEPGNQLDQRALGRSGLADNPHGLPRLDVEGDVGEHVLLRLSLIFEIDVVEADVSALHPDILCLVVPDIDLLVHDLGDPFPGSQGPGHHQKHVGEHHQGVEHLHHIAEEAGQLAHLEAAHRG